MNEPRIATMNEPSSDDVTASIVTSVYNARTLLSDAEDQQISLPRSIALCGRAAWLLAAMTATLSASCYAKNKATRVRVLRALLAARVAKSLGALAHAYATSGPRDEPFRDAALEDRIAKQTMMRFRKATEFARDEAHRALTQLAEDFPNAYATIDITS